MTIEDLRMWMAESSKNHAKSSMARKTVAVRGFFAWTHEHGVTTTDPACALMTPKIPDTLPDVLSESQAEQLMERVDVIAAEDTRNTLKLLNHFEIKTPMTSYHEHNKVTKGPVLVERLLAGESIALVTDAGMPGISDPGADLVKLCYAAGVPVTVAPGASAAVGALVLSGMDTRRFVFEGFLPPDKKERRAILKTLEREHRTMIFYEAPHRLTDTLAELAELFGESREVAAVRELTKKFEEVRRATIGEHLRYFSENPPKGEFVLVCEGFSLEAQRQAEREGWESISVEEHVAKYVAEGMSEKDAMKQAAKDRGVSKREIYQILKK